MSRQIPTARDVQCPTCGAEPGNPCTSLGGGVTPKGQPARRIHDARYAALPKRPNGCGTYAGYQRHTKAGEEVCEPCRLARNEYIAQHRRANPAEYAEAKRLDNARLRALWRLAKAYPDEFRAYTLEESKR